MRPLSVQLAVTRTVRDAALLLDVAAGPEVGDAITLPAPPAPYRDLAQSAPPALRVGLMTTFPARDDAVYADGVAAVELTGRLLEAAGHRVEAAHPPALDSPVGLRAFMPIWSAMAASNLATWGDRLGRALGPEDVEPLTWELAEWGKNVDAVAFQGAIATMHAYARSVMSWWADGWDVLVTSTLGEPPAELGVLSTPDDPMTGFARGATFTPYTPVANQTGQPAVSLPLATGSDGLPVGVHLVADYGREDLLLQLAAQLETAAPWSDRRPPLFA
jgi:amidase